MKKLLLLGFNLIFGVSEIIAQRARVGTIVDDTDPSSDRGFESIPGFLILAGITWILKEIYLARGKKRNEKYDAADAWTSAIITVVVLFVLILIIVV